MKKLLLSQILVVACSCTCSGSIAGTDNGPWHDANIQDFPDSVISWDGSLCGNRVVEPGEECDDGDRHDCDGCDRNCRIEAEACAGQDASSDGDEIADGIEDNAAEAPPAPQPITELTPVAQPDGEPVVVASMDPRLNLIWTGSCYAIVYKRNRPGDYHYTNVMAMRRFDSEGSVLGADWIYEPREDLDIEHFDACWNGNGFGLAWVQGRSVYFLRLNADGKPQGESVTVCDDCLPFLEGPIAVPPVKIGCTHGAYLLGYNIEVDYLVFELWLQSLDEAGHPGQGKFFGPGDYLDRGHAPTSLRSTGNGWVLLHGPTDPEYCTVVLEGMSPDLLLLWRSCLSHGLPPEFDYDLDDGQALTVFMESSDLFSMARVDLSSGEVLAIHETVYDAYRIVSMGDGSAALLQVVATMDGEIVNGLILSTVDGEGRESEGAFIMPDTLDTRYDLAWTGSEIGVVLEITPPEGGSSEYYLQRFVP
jgi:cysteine-rich repeat protein